MYVVSRVSGTITELCALHFQVYERGTNVDQFVTRFLLKETANQIQSLLSSVESAVDAIDEQTNQIRLVTYSDRLHSAAYCCFHKLMFAWSLTRFFGSPGAGGWILIKSVCILTLWFLSFSNPFYFILNGQVIQARDRKQCYSFCKLSNCFLYPLKPRNSEGCSYMENH